MEDFRVDLVIGRARARAFIPSSQSFHLIGAQLAPASSPLHFVRVSVSSTDSIFIAGRSVHHLHRSAKILSIEMDEGGAKKSPAVAAEHRALPIVFFAVARLRGSRAARPITAA